MSESLSDLMARYGPECVCPKCPSYTTCAKVRSQRIFCLTGKSPSNCIRMERGCVCPNCPVSSALEKGDRYYCMRD